MDLVLKYGQSGRGRVACLEPASEGISDKILLSLFFICLEGFFKNDAVVAGFSDTGLEAGD